MLRNTIIKTAAVHMYTAIFEIKIKVIIFYTNDDRNIFSITKNIQYMYIL